MSARTVRIVAALAVLLGVGGIVLAGLLLASDRGAAPRDAAPADHAPPWLNQAYSDGTLTIRYPQGWIENDTKRFGHVLSDVDSFTAAFVGVQYLARREYADHRAFAELARRIVRPPDGFGTTIQYTQAAKIGGRRGMEASIIWATSSEAPVGPTMRVFGFELDSGKVAVLIFAAESPSRHAIQFAWIKKRIAWGGG